ncbi:glycosyltransferase [Sphingobacterium sp. 2149]|uniref:glycosyltransferase family 2 protein n=1 Tax=Sphingobacterium sp. 2149 TaxID=2817763 RepID=UPI00285886E5|nr:glycosyltransferase [Sphingobacterium sp. 2149]MDR6733854.1 glycosyltransferase involved in cell wall biosynthesis [Sphingobacterium sp. 2149]
MKPLVSIIIPVYNVAEFLPACIDSLVCQTYENLEILLINDGSYDNSGDICDEYAKTDFRIKVVHKENGGLSDTRNIGLDIAEGEYISFIDSDDVIHKQFIDTLLGILIASEAEISMCDYTKFSSILPTTLRDNKVDFETYSGEYMLNNLYNKHWVPKNVIACNKLYSSRVWEDLRYTSGVLHEDEYIIHELYAKVKKVAYCQLPLYYYRQRHSSITNEISPKRIHDTLNIFNNREAFFRQHGYNHLIQKNIQARLLNIILLAISYNNSETERLLRKNLTSILKQPNISPQLKCSSMILAAFPKLFWAAKRVKRAVFKSREHSI